MKRKKGRHREDEPKSVGYKWLTRRKWHGQSTGVVMVEAIAW